MKNNAIIYAVIGAIIACFITYYIGLLEGAKVAIESAAVIDETHIEYNLPIGYFMGGVHEYF